MASRIKSVINTKIPYNIIEIKRQYCILTDFVVIHVSINSHFEKKRTHT